MAHLKDLIVNGAARVLGSFTASSIIKLGGTSDQFLKADGSVSTLGTAATKNTVGIFSSEQHSDYNNNQGDLITRSFISYWNGAYNSSGASNLTYCAQGTIIGSNNIRSLSVKYATSADYANVIINNGVLDSQEKIDNFISGSRLKYATFSSNDNNLGFAGNDGMIISIPWSSKDYGAQMAFDDTQTGTVKVRGKNNTWGNWYTILHSGNYNSYSPKLDGTGATGTWGINISGNSDTCDNLRVHTGRNNEANKIVRTDESGYIQCGYINSSSGNEGNNSSPARVWGTNGSDNYLRTYLTSALNVGYATSAGDADTVDGLHASSFYLSGKGFLQGSQTYNTNWNALFQYESAGGAARSFLLNIEAHHTSTVINKTLHITTTLSGGAHIREFYSSNYGSKFKIRVGSVDNYWRNTRVDIQRVNGVDEIIRFKVISLDQGTITEIKDTNVSALAYSYEYEMCNIESTTVSYSTSAGSVAWKNITEKPSYFTPSSHTHTKSEITNFPTSLPANGGNADTLDGIDSTGFLRKVTVANNTENDFNTFSNMTLTGRGDPTTGASLKNAPWTGAGPDGGYGVLTYLWSSYGTQMAWGYGSDRIYIRHKYYYNNDSNWSSTWNSLALTSDIPTKVSQLTNDAGYKTTDTTYTTATSNTLGLVKIGYTANNKNYPVLLNDDGKMYVNVPWTDNNTTYNFSGTTFYSGNSDTAEHNANSAIKNGHYYYTSNGPSTSLGASTSDGALYAQSYSDSWVAQIAQDYRNGRLFVRSKNNGTWQDWKRIAITGESQPANGGTSSYVTVNSTSSSSSYNILFHDVNTIYSNASLKVVPSSGNVISSGHFYANSDIRYKNIIEYYYSLSNKIAQLPIIKYKWTDRDDNSIRIGSSALSVMNIIPELVSYDDNTDFYSLDYATLGAIAGISACKEVEMLKLKIKELELEIIILKSKYNG